MDDGRWTMGAIVHRPSSIVHRLSSLTGPALALGSLLLYSRTLAPSLGGTIDSAEFQQAAYSLGIVHPTGYPLYLLAARLWITLFPFGDPAFRVNLLSALFAALSLWVLFATVRHLIGSLLAGVSASALFAVQAIPWAQASVAEVNSLNTLLTGLAFFAVVLWATGKLPLPVVALAYGLAASHHRTALLYAPLLLIFMLVALRWGAPRLTTLKQALLALFLLVLPFVPYLYVPLRGFTTDWYSNTWDGFWSEVLGESALPVIGGALGRPVIPRFRSLLFGQIFSGVQGYVLLLLGLIGLGVAVWLLVRRTRPSETEQESRARRFRGAGVVLYAASFFLGALFATLYDILDVGDYLGVPIFMWCVVSGAGVAALLAASSMLRVSSNLKLATRYTLLAALAVLCLFTAYRSLHRSDLRIDFSDLDRRSYWQGVKAQDSNLPKGATLIADWPEAHEAQYVQQVEGWRPDVKIAIVDGLLSGDGLQIDRWLADKRPLYMLGEQSAILARYTTDHQGPLWKITGRQAESATPPMTHTLNRRFGDGIVLVGYTLQPDPPTLKPGGLLNLTLYWKATQKVNDRYVVFNHIIDDQGGKVGQVDGEPGRGLSPTVYWKPGDIITDTYPIAINANAPPGQYRLMTGLYTRLGEHRLEAFSPEGASLGDYPELATITVER